MCVCSTRVHPSGFTLCLMHDGDITMTPFCMSHRPRSPVPKDTSSNHTSRREEAATGAGSPSLAGLRSMIAAHATTGSAATATAARKMWVRQPPFAFPPIRLPAQTAATHMVLPPPPTWFCRRLTIIPPLPTPPHQTTGLGPAHRPQAVRRLCEQGQRALGRPLRHPAAVGGGRGAGPPARHRRVGARVAGH